MFFLLYRHPNDAVFDDFLKISNHFPKILENLSEGHTNVAEHSPKTSENFQRWSETFDEDPKMFWSCTNELKNNLRDKLYSSEIIYILTSEDMENTLLESWM